MAEVKKNLQLVEGDLPDDDLLCEIDVDDYPILLDCKHVIAQPKSIRLVNFPWGPRIVFECKVLEPDKYFGRKLPMYVPIRQSWGKKPPTKSKLKKLAVLFCPNGRFTKSAFLNKLFKCRLKRRTKGDAPYSIIEMFEERHAGK